MSEIPTSGAYRHFKGDIYFVLGAARHSEDPDQLLVIYANKDGENWARPLSMWSELVDAPSGDGKIPRFKKLD